MRARERRVDLVVGGAEERGDRVGVEGGIETRAGLAGGGGRGGHGGQPTKPGGHPWSEAGLGRGIPGEGVDDRMYGRILFRIGCGLRTIQGLPNPHTEP
jgi:hypothetical protein